MKNAILIFFFLFSLSALSQNAPNESGSEIFTIVENAAEFPGGTAAMGKFIQTNLKYPDMAREFGMGGKVFLKFVIDENGYLRAPEVLKGSGFGILDSEAVRVVKTMPVWKPAMMSGRNVKCYFNLPISFMIDGPYFIVNMFNKNEKYLQAKNELEKYDLDAALKLYQQDIGDVEAWYNMAVIYFFKKQKSESKRYFENVKNNAEQTSKYYSLSSRFLEQNF